jgi:hypothetical protein
MRIEFMLPLRTVSLTNQRGHWAKRARRSAHERALVAAVWTTTGGNPVLRPGETATVTLTRVAPRVLDDDNVRGAMKSVRDEIAECVGVDDRDPRVKWLYVQERGKPNEYAVRVTVEVVTEKGAA